MDEDDTALSNIESEIRKFLAQNTGAMYNTVDSWALIVRARSNDGDGDRHFGGLFTPPDQDMFTNAGLRWLFDEGLKQRGY
jgi:hypothetical protein